MKNLLIQNILYLFVFIFYHEYSFAISKNIAIIYGFGGKEDKSFNSSANKGVLQIRKKLHLNVIEKEPLSPKEIVPFIESVIQDKDAKLIIATGYEHVETINSLKDKHPNVQFVAVDYNMSGGNLTAINFLSEQSSYLAGYLASNYSVSKKIGLIGGIKIPVIDDFLRGYKQGAQRADSKIEVFDEYIGNNSYAWSNPTAAKAMARRMYSKNIDVIFGVAGASNLGIFEAAKELGKNVIGVDSNQNGIIPGKVLTSVTKEVNVGVFLAAQLFLQNKLKGETISLGLKDKAVDIIFDQNNKNLFKNGLLEQLKKIRDQIELNNIIINKP